MGLSGTKRVSLRIFSGLTQDRMLLNENRLGRVITYGEDADTRRLAPSTTL